MWRVITSGVLCNQYDLAKYVAYSGAQRLVYRPARTCVRLLIGSVAPLILTQHVQMLIHTDASLAAPAYIMQQNTEVLYSCSQRLR